MKKIILIIIFLTLFNCNSPKSTLHDFFNAVGDKNWDAAGKLGTDRTKKLLGLMAAFAAAEDMSEAKKRTVKSCTEEGDMAECTLDNGKIIQLVKVDGKWKVDMTKD